MDRYDLKIGINCIIINEKGQLLLGKRLKEVGYLTYGLPGGHLKNGETIEEAAIREIKEETNLCVDINDVKVINFGRTNDYIQIGVLVKKYSGELNNNEPKNCDGFYFFDINNLPELFFGTKINIDLYLQDKFYSPDVNIN